jgi:D-alanyl-D-alanine carboxypeptidase/D-alanyl-D-alanine-endopeptidase (penicillin-binding protein 4)
MRSQTRVLSFGLWLSSALIAGGVAAEDDATTAVRRVVAGLGVADGTASVVVLDPEGRTLVDVDGSDWRKPASNLKILTSIAALELLGADYEFVTRLWATAPILEGEIDGDVVLWGTGDPNISGRFYDGRPTTILESWADALRAAGIERIRGRLLVDDSFFDGETYPASWTRKEIARPYRAEVSALTFNDNCVEIGVEPSAPGQPARVSVSPASPFVSVLGAPTTVAGSGRVELRRKVDSNEIIASGSISSRTKNWYDSISVRDPALHFGHVLRRVFAERGVKIDGGVERKASAPSSDTEKEPMPEESSATPLAQGRRRPVAWIADRDGAPSSTSWLLVEHRSRLETDLPIVNKHSQNLHAEIILRSLGARIHGEGSRRAGETAIRSLLEEMRIAVDGLVVADGSGLSHDNRVNADLIAVCLHRAASRPWFDVFERSLAIPGEAGTLTKRFRSRDRVELGRRVRAKSGFISGVSALSGYAYFGERRYAFSMLFSGLPGGLDRIQDCQERILEELDRRIGAR